MNIRYTYVINVIGLVLFVGCGDSSEFRCNEITFGKIGAFSSDGELNGYLRCEANELNAKKEDDDSGIPTVNQAPAASTNEEVTNNQEQGVDEGGIVKNIGNHLVVLRKGRLYSLTTAEPGNPTQTDSIRIASSDALNKGVWYDELLVESNRIYVIGYRYNTPEPAGANRVRGATEINSFFLENGKFRRGKTLFLESNDYYSWRNYTGRMVGGKLVLYLPFYGLSYLDGHYRPHVPHFLSYEDGFLPQRPLFGGNDVFIPIDAPNSPTFHTIVQCSLPENGDLDCRAKSLLGSWMREYYVSNNRIYLWNGSQVYAFDFRDLNVRAHKVRGYPRDQFSFKEKDETLHALAVDWNGSINHWQFHSLPLRDFNEYANQDLTEIRVKEIATSNGYHWTTRNRFVGDNLLISTGDRNNQQLLIYGIENYSLTRIPLDAYTARIEAIGTDRALVVGQNFDFENSKLILSTIRLDQSPRKSNSIEISGVQGEWRSHGFFFNSESSGGVFGLPILNTDSDRSYWYGTGVSNIAFVRVNENGELFSLGQTSSTQDAAGVCETSCVDWYGNTRPIFVHGRSFGLMGSEFQEIEIEVESISDLGDRLILGR